MKKRGFVWISAVLYIALGVVAISLVMTAGLPLINKMKDRNTVIQTKELLHTIDKNIWQVRSEGVGSRRFLEPVIIKGGKLMIYDNEHGVEEGKNKLLWRIKTKAKLIETGVDYTEGNLVMKSEQTNVEGEDWVILELDYGKRENIDIILEEGYTSGSALTGKYAISIENTGGKQITLTVI